MLILSNNLAAHHAVRESAELARGGLDGRSVPKYVRSSICTYWTD